MSYANKEMIQQLSLDLVSFGLNPRDWKLVQESEKLYKIISDDDQDFAFKGSVIKKQKKSSWEKIEILSL